MSPRSIVAALLAVLAVGGVAQAKFVKNTPSAEPDVSLGDFSASIGDLELRKTALYAENVELSDGHTTWLLKEGFVFRVWSTDEDRDDLTAGYVFVGEGTASVGFESRAEAWRFGNRQVRAGRDADELERLKDGGRFALPLSRMVLLTLDETVHATFEALPQVGGGARGEAMEGDTILVLDERTNLGALQNQAERALRRRLQELEEGGVDPEKILSRDLLRTQRLGLPTDQCTLIVDSLAEDAMGVSEVGGLNLFPSKDDRWLTHVRDPTGFADLRHRSRTLVFGNVTLQGGGLMVNSTAVAEGAMETIEDPTLPTLGGLGGTDSSGAGQNDTLASELEASAEEGDGSLLASGAATLVTLTTEAFEAVDGVPLPEVRPDPLKGEAFVRARSTRNRMVLELDVETRLTVQAAGGPIGDVTLKIRREEATVGGFDIMQVVDRSGGALSYARLDKDEGPLDFETYARITVVLPEVLQEGEQATFTVRWRDTWHLANMRLSSGVTPNAGSSTGFHRVLPLLEPWDGDTAWRYRLRVGVPEFDMDAPAPDRDKEAWMPWDGPPRSADNKLVAALSGRTMNTWHADGLRWVESSGGPTIWSGLAIGEWISKDEDAWAGMPAIRVNLLKGDRYYLDEFPPQLRAAVNFLQNFLPDFPHGDFELFQDATVSYMPIQRWTRAMAADTSNLNALDIAYMGFTRGYAPDGLMNIARVTAGAYETRVRNAFPEWEFADMARQMAAQWWGSATYPANSRERWIPDVLSEVYAQLFVLAAFGTEPYDIRLETTRDIWTRTNPPAGPFALTAMAPQYATVSSLHYGPYLFSWTLRNRLGHENMMRGLDELAEARMGKPLTTEMVQEALEQASGQDLDDFFDTWIHSGQLPELAFRYGTEEAWGGYLRVRGELTTSVPFGIFEVPLVAVDADGSEQEFLVRVEHGRAWVDEVVRLDPPWTLALDPKNLLLQSKKPKVDELGGRGFEKLLAEEAERSGDAAAPEASEADGE